MIARADTSHYADEILERILDRGIVLDGLSHLAALAGAPDMRAKAMPDSDVHRSTPMSVLCPPRQHERD